MKIVSCLLLFSCGPTYPTGHTLDRPRILAVRLDPPEATIGDDVRAQALVAFPEGDDPQANVVLWQCPPDGYFPQGCAGAEGAQIVGDTEGSFEVGEEWRERATLADPYDVYLVVTATLAAGDDEDAALKRLVVGLPDPDQPPNENPTLESIEAAREGDDVVLTPIVGEGSVESYDLRTIEGDLVPAEEEMFVSWYATCGALGSTLTRGDALPTSWHGDEDCTVLAVLRDGRGGTDWASIATSEIGPGR